MNPLKAFNFKTKEVIGYIEHFDDDPEENDDAVVNFVDVYLSRGQIVTLDLTDDAISASDLAKTFDYDGSYWNTLYAKENNPTNLCKSTMKSEVKSTYNPYE